MFSQKLQASASYTICYEIALVARIAVKKEKKKQFEELSIHRGLKLLAWGELGVNRLTLTTP